ncbi:MAG TPA: aspartate/glutamate racemase family protein [Trebonia sp.]|nr:aspartate/glutamate racemase family protein [Trebonia sp.]
MTWSPRSARSRARPPAGHDATAGPVLGPGSARPAARPAARAGSHPLVTAARIGVLCLDTSFTKPPGHIRNPATFSFPVTYRVVAGATPGRVVTDPDPALLGPFIDAARELEAGGVAAITGACGFLVAFQRELAASVGIPLFTSSLLQVPLAARMLPAGKRVGVLAASAGALTARHFEAAGAAGIPVHVAGMARYPEFREVILEGRRDRLDLAALRAETLAEAGSLIARHPSIGALVLECTDLAPFSPALAAALGRPVFDIVTLTEWVHRGLAPRPYPAG